MQFFKITFVMALRFLNVPLLWTFKSTFYRYSNILGAGNFYRYSNILGTGNLFKPKFIAHSHDKVIT